MNPSHKNRRFIAMVAMALFAALAQPNASLGSKTSSAGKTARILLAGGQDVLWVARAGEGDEGDKFDLIIRRPGGKWRTLARFSGDPVAMVAGDRRLHLVTGGSTPNASVFTLAESEGRIFLRGKGPRPGGRWPLGDPPSAICQAPPLGKSKLPGFIAVIAHESDKLSTTTAASQPAPKRSGLTLLQTVEGQWEPLGEINNVPNTVGARISVAATDSWVYVLAVPSDDLPARLLAWNTTNKETIWKDVALPDAPQQPLTVSVLRGQPVLVTIAPAGWTPASPTTLPKVGGIELNIHELKGDKLAKTSKSIKYQDKPLTLPAASIPETASFGKTSERQLVLLWRETESYRCALVDLNGDVVENKEVEELLKETPAFDTGAILNYFLAAIPVLALGFILIGRQKAPIGPMVLPANFVPSSIPKRLVAIVIDFAPFLLLASLALVAINPNMQPEDIQELQALMSEQQNIPFEPLVCMLGSLVAWVIYGSIMESKFGATLGKMAMGIEVTSIDGKKPTVRQAVLRNLIRPIEMRWPIIIITIAISLLTRTRQRLGDMLGRTVVVEKRRLPSSDDSQETKSEPPKEI
jgi:uncharacterized RDD family membrane protein YckC